MRRYHAKSPAATAVPAHPEIPLRTNKIGADTPPRRPRTTAIPTFIWRLTWENMITREVISYVA